MCFLPTYWTPYVAVGTTFVCEDCGREWFLNKDKKWQSAEDAE